MTEPENTWDERVQDWLDSLDQPLRTAAEAVVDEYLNPVRYEPIGDADDWVPQPGIEYGITVDFDREEIRLISDALQPERSPIQLMKQLLLERAAEVVTERQNSDSDPAAAD